MIENFLLLNQYQNMTAPETNEEINMPDLQASLKELTKNKAWIFLTSIWTEAHDTIESNILKTRTDQRLIFNADHIMKERRDVIEIMLNAPIVKIKELEDSIFATTQQAKPLEERLQDYGENFKKESIKKGLIK